MITDWPEFARLTDPCKSDVFTKLNSIAAVTAATRGNKSRVIAAQSANRCVSKATIYREILAFQDRGWRGLIDERRYGHESGLPGVFKDFIRGSFDDHQRQHDVGREVHRKLMDRLRQWRKSGDQKFQIAGYESPPKNQLGKSHPPGWSYKNIMRFKPTGRSAALVKLGRKAAADFLPSVLTTRLGSHVLQRVYFDDQDYDNKVVMSGLPETARPIGFNALDHHSASHLGYHLRLLARLDDDDESKKALTGMEFTWFNLHLLQTVGYRTDEHKTRHVFEWGTANSWNNKKLNSFGGFNSYEENLSAITNGQVEIDRSGKFNTAAFAGMLFRPSSTGNFKYKTWIESAFKLVRTYMQALPGPMGNKYQVAPEELPGIDRYEKQLLKAIETKLTPHQAALLKHPLLTYYQFAEITRAVYRAINARTDHSLEAWDELQYHKSFWRHNTDSEIWMPAHELDNIPDPQEREFHRARLARDPHLTKMERLSPSEVLQIQMSNDRKVIKTLDDSAIPLLIPREWAIFKTIGRDKTITIQDPFYKKTNHQFVAQIHKGVLRSTVRPGTDVLCYYNPFDGDRLPVCSTAGEYLGTLVRTVPRQLANPEDTIRQLEVRSGLMSDDDVSVGARASTIMEHRQTMKTDNDRIIAGEETDPQKRRSDSAAKAAKTRQNKKAESILLDAFGSTPDTEEKPLPEIQF